MRLADVAFRCPDCNKLLCLVHLYLGEHFTLYFELYCTGCQAAQFRGLTVQDLLEEFHKFRIAEPEPQKLLNASKDLTPEDFAWLHKELGIVDAVKKSDP